MFKNMNVIDYVQQLVTKEIHEELNIVSKIKLNFANNLDTLLTYFYTIGTLLFHEKERFISKFQNNMYDEYYNIVTNHIYVIIFYIEMFKSQTNSLCN